MSDKKSKQPRLKERSNADAPLWRKKVDNTLFSESSTPIPAWMVKGWNLRKIFSSLYESRKNQTVTIVFDKKSYEGALNLRGNKTFLRFEPTLTDNLKLVFTMSYMRELESSIRDKNLDDEIPFWEFLDIEFNAENKTFLFTAHYTQTPIFKELFKSLVGSAAVRGIEDFVFDRESKIYRQHWKKREDLKTELDIYNGVYTLLDEKNRLLYVGESNNIKRRLTEGPHPEIPKWTHFSFEALPGGTTKKTRCKIEDMLIRQYAAVLENKKPGFPIIAISNYKLVNKNIRN